MSYRVVFSPEAEEQLVALYRYIAAAASLNIAARYTGAIITYCEKLEYLPASRHHARRCAPWPSHHERLTQPGCATLTLVKKLELI